MAQMIKVAFHNPLRYLAAINIAITSTKQKHKLKNGDTFGFPLVIRLKIIGIKVKAIKIRIVATTLGVNAFFTCANTPVTLTAVRIKPPNTMDEYTALGLLPWLEVIPTSSITAGPIITGKR